MEDGVNVERYAQMDLLCILQRNLSCSDGRQITKSAEADV
jgi:hypothetical protein